MTMQREIGSLFMAGVPGTTLDPSTRTLIEQAGIGQFILFTRNVASPDQLARLCADLTACCRDNGIEALIAIDQEGGTVARLPPPFTQFPDPRQVAETPDPEATVARNAARCAAELRETGITMNLAPVVDVCPAGQGLYMERRSLGSDPDTVARLASRYIAILQQNGIAACAKHFPGLGAARLDPHSDLFQVENSEEVIRTTDLPPFKKAINAGVAAVMSSHTIHPALDPERPATLSRRILTGLLRDEMGFQGAILTDDMEMGAIADHMDIADAAPQALEAGADLILICHDHDTVNRAHAAVIRAVDKGRCNSREIEKSCRRVQHLKSDNQF